MLRLDLCDYNGLDIITACFIVLPALVASWASWMGLARALPEHATGGCDYGQGNFILIALPSEGLLK